MEQEFLDFLKDLEQSNEAWKNELERRLEDLEMHYIKATQSATQSHTQSSGLARQLNSLKEGQDRLEGLLKVAAQESGRAADAFNDLKKREAENAQNISEIFDILQALTK